VKYAKRPKRRFGDSEVLHIFILYTIWMSVDGGGGIFKRTKLDKGKGGIAKVVSV